MRRLGLVLGLLLCASRVEAVCDETALGTSAAQATTALSHIVAGQTACIPDTSGTVTWTSAVVIAAGKKLRGEHDVTVDANGRPISCPTTITVGNFGGATPQILTLNPSAAGGLTELSNLCIDKNNTTGGNGQAIQIAGTGLNSYRVHLVRIDNLLGRGLSIQAVPAGSNFSGLTDHSYLKKTASGSPQGAEFIGALAFDNSPMARPYTLGTNSAHYFEDNTVEFCCEKADSALDGYGGCQFTARWNIIINTELSVGHGNDSGGYRGCRQFEVYKNTFSNSISNINPGQYRSASGTIWGNVYTGGWTDFTPTIYRACPQEFVGEGPAFLTYGMGDGTSPWDLNIGPHGYVYIDQWGWTFDDVQGHAPIHTPVYIWQNTDDGNPIAVVPGTAGIYGTTPGGACTYTMSDFLQADREWFLYNASFSGPSGMGVGTKATMTAIATCTQYTAFWVTDEGNWDAVHAGTDGRLYQCNPANTWTLYYTPYTYPHPLQAASGYTAPTSRPGRKLRRMVERLIPAPRPLAARSQLARLNTRHRATSPVLQAEQAVDEPFFHLPLSWFTFAHTYHVAPNASGASCSNDGLTATYTSGTNGPWLDFSCLAVRTALGVSSTVVYLHAGTYNLGASVGTYGNNGLSINNASGTITTPIVLAPYPGDSVTITGSECYTYAQIHEVYTSNTMDGVPFNPNTANTHIRQVLNLSGNYVIVDSGLTLRCGFRSVVQWSCTHCVVRGATMYGAYEDANKFLATAQHLALLNSDISGFSSQAVDWYAADYGFVSGNTIHDAIQDPPTGAYVAVAVGAKGGVRYGVVSRNTVTSLASNATHQAFSLGGAPNAAVDETSGGHLIPSAQYFKVMGNTVTNFYGVVCAIQGGVDSECSYNVASNTLGLARIGTDPDVRAADPTNYSDQPLTSNAVLRGNRFSLLPKQCTAPVTGESCYGLNVINTAEAVGLVGDVNVYTSTAGTSPAFIYGAGQIDIAAFRTASGGVETTSTVVAP